jgi:hypothetical protein
MQPAQERRSQPRYRLGEGAIAISANNPGHIQNISMGGLSFVYLHGDTTGQEGKTVDILDGQNDFFMEALPCRTVSEKLLINDSSFSMIRMVQCSIEFGQLSRAQKAQLESYLSQHSATYA